MKIFVFDKWKIVRYICTLFIISAVFTLTGNITSNIISTVANASKKLPIYCIETQSNDISLTFDCAWGAEDMERILNILKENEVRATFFVLGEWAEKFPEMIKRMAEEGHDVANHSDTHPHIASLSYDEICKEIKSANDKINKLTGKTNDLFRAPYGEYNDNVIKAAEDMGCYTIQWDTDSLDWKDLGKQNILNRVLTRTKKGSIILMHNGTKDTVNVLDEMIKKLKEKGFEFVPTSEFIYRENYTIDHTGKQIKGA